MRPGVAANEVPAWHRPIRPVVLIRPTVVPKGPYVLATSAARLRLIGFVALAAEFSVRSNVANACP